MSTIGHIYRDDWHSGIRCWCHDATDADLAARRRGGYRDGQRDETWCVTRDGQQLEPGQVVAIMTPIRFHQGYGYVTQLLPGSAGDVPCVMVTDGYGRRTVVNAVNVTIDAGFADLIAVDEIERRAGSAPAR